MVLLEIDSDLRMKLFLKNNPMHCSPIEDSPDAKHDDPVWRGAKRLRFALAGDQ
jgi:hypothetical protein